MTDVEDSKAKRWNVWSMTLKMENGPTKEDLIKISEWKAEVTLGVGKMAVQFGPVENLNSDHMEPDVHAIIKFSRTNGSGWQRSKHNAWQDFVQHFRSCMREQLDLEVQHLKQVWFQPTKCIKSWTAYIFKTKDEHKKPGKEDITETLDRAADELKVEGKKINMYNLQNLFVKQNRLREWKNLKTEAPAYLAAKHAFQDVAVVPDDVCEEERTRNTMAYIIGKKERLDDSTISAPKAQMGEETKRNYVNAWLFMAPNIKRVEQDGLPQLFLAGAAGVGKTSMAAPFGGYTSITKDAEGVGRYAPRMGTNLIVWNDWPMECLKKDTNQSTIKQYAGAETHAVKTYAKTDQVEYYWCIITTNDSLSSDSSVFSTHDEHQEAWERRFVRLEWTQKEYSKVQISRMSRKLLNALHAVEVYDAVNTGRLDWCFHHYPMMRTYLEEIYKQKGEEFQQTLSTSAIATSLPIVQWDLIQKETQTVKGAKSTYYKNLFAKYEPLPVLDQQKDATHATTAKDSMDAEDQGEDVVDTTKEEQEYFKNFVARGEKMN